jgi:hypothetical protein
MFKLPKICLIGLLLIFAIVAGISTAVKAQTNSSAQVALSYDSSTPASADIAVGAKKATLVNYKISVDNGVFNLPTITLDLDTSKAAVGDITALYVYKSEVLIGTGEFNAKGRVAIDLPVIIPNSTSQVWEIKADISSSAVIGHQISLGMANLSFPTQNDFEFTQMPFGGSNPMTIIAANEPPVITAASGPTNLKINETGTWSIQANDPDGNSLTYKVDWGDLQKTEEDTSSMSLIDQTATFTHSDSKAGDYTITFTVTDISGDSASSSLTIQVDASDADNTPPELIDVWTDKEIYYVGDTPIIYVKAKDDWSGMQTIRVEYTAPSQEANNCQKTTILAAYDNVSSVADGPNLYKLAVTCGTPIQDYRESGTYTLDNVTLYDKAGNYIVYEKNDGSELSINDSFVIDTSTSKDLPDLTITKTDWNLGKNNVGQKTIFYDITVKNQGEAKAQEFAIGKYVSLGDKVEGTDAFTIGGPLSAGEEKIYTLETSYDEDYTWVKSGYTYKFKIILDSYNVVEESNENNNVHISDVKLAGEQVQCTDSDGGKNYYKRGKTTQNHDRYGSGTTDDSCDGNILRERYCGEGGVIAEILYTCPNSCQEGACVLDDDSAQITGISPTAGLPGTTLTIYGKNLKDDCGDKGTLECQAEISFGDYVLARQNFIFYDVLWSDDKISLKVPEGAETGNIRVHRNEIFNWGESNSYNKIYDVIGPVFTVNLSKLPDLIATKLVINNTSRDNHTGFKAGDIVDITVEFKNGGGKAANEFYYTVSGFDPISRIRTNILSLKAGESYQYTHRISWNQETDQEVTFILEVDSDHQIVESDENNNLLVKKIASAREETLDGQSRYVTPAKIDRQILKLQRAVSELEKKVVELEAKLVKKIDQVIVDKVKGRILLQVEENGEAWYVDPTSENKFYMRNGRAAYDMMSALGLGITNANLEKIPIGIQENIFALKDTDGDGIPDKAEEAIGTDPEQADTDGDGIPDKAEILNGYKPTSQEKYVYDNKLVNRFKGRILLQVEENGEAWYINPADNKRYYLGDPNSAFNVMRFLSLGIKNSDLRQIQVGKFEKS